MNGSVLVWGPTPIGQFFSPNPIAHHSKIMTVAIGHSFGVVVDIHGDSYSYGMGEKNNLNDPDRENGCLVQIKGLSKNLISVSAGYDHVAAIG